MIVLSLGSGPSPPIANSAFYDKYSVCVASTIRIVTMNQLVHSPDFTWAMSKVFIWSCCEPFIGIVCACLPTYAPLVRRWWSAAAAASQANKRSGGDGPAQDGSYENVKPFKGDHQNVIVVHGDKAQISSSSSGARSGWGLGSMGKGMYGFGDTTLRGDDEIELTGDMNLAYGPADWGKGGPGGRGYLGEIMVRKDFSWESSV